MIQPAYLQSEWMENWRDGLNSTPYHEKLITVASVTLISDISPLLLQILN